MQQRPRAPRRPAVGAPAHVRRRVRVRVEGTVQGVGFRPYVYRLAHELDLGGYVLNDARGVLLEVEGTGTAVEGLLARVEPDAPPLAVIERVEVEPLRAYRRGRLRHTREPARARRSRRRSHLTARRARTA